jgi:hypothetical protein
MRDFQRAIDKAIAVATRHQRELLDYPGVVAVGVGPERKRGVMTGKAAIVVTVRTKRSVADLKERGEKPLPSVLEGVSVDVIELGKPVEAREILAEQRKAKDIVDEVGPAYLRKPNVTAIGVGYKTVRGQTITNQVAVKIFVGEKLPPGELRRRGLERIPATIKGVPTDVEELKPQRPTADASGSRGDRKDPLVGGISIGVGSKPFWRGTLGAIVFDRSDGRQLVLSNQHVLDAPVGTDVIQPAPVELDDSIEVGFQLDICGPLHFIRLDTPNTTVGTVLAGAAVAAVVAAALSDIIDPTRRGQEATVPPPGAQTVEEAHRVRLDYPAMPIPGTHFPVKTEWRYTRRTDMGDALHSVSEEQTNPHALVEKLLLTDKVRYTPGETIRLFGLILPEGCAPRSDRNPGRPIGPDELRRLTRAPSVALSPNLNLAVAGPRPQIVRPSPADASSAATASALAAASHKLCRCDLYHATALLTPTLVDRAFPIVLRQPTRAARNRLLVDLLTVVRDRNDDKLTSRVFGMVRYGCFLYGELTVGDFPLGPWKHYLYVQTVNIAPQGMDPLLAARIIGGLPVSQNMKPVINVACGPLIIEDGQFDIELL